MLSSSAVTVSQCCNPESNRHWLHKRCSCGGVPTHSAAHRLAVCSFVCLFVRSFVCPFVFSFGFLVWFVRFLARLLLCIGYFVQVGINATLIIYAYYILTGYVNKMLMSPIVALTYNQVGGSRAEPHR